MKRSISFFLLILTIIPLAQSQRQITSGTYISGSSLEKDFLQPPLSAKPIMIWQWMDGLVSEAGITADLEALNHEKDQLDTLFSSGATIDDAAQKAARYQEIKDILDELEMRWLELSEKK